MGFKPLPRSGGAQNVVLTGDLWDRLCDMVESALNLSVSAPLSLASSLAGRTLSITQQQTVGLVTVTGNATQPGVYTGYLRRPVIQKYDQTSTGTLNSDGVNQFGEPPSDTSEIYILNAAEESTNTHALMDASADTSRTHVGVLLAMAADDGKPVWVINGSTAKICS